MCGIAGLFYFERHPPENIVRELSSATRVMSNRGPDSATVWADGHMGLACNRLAITGSTAQSVQPHCDQLGGLTVCNGEIYNAREIAREEGFELSESTCDTDVLSRGFARHGYKLLPRLRGPFAFIRYVPTSGKVQLVRDFVGKKPLYYARLSSGWVFGSNVQSIHLARRPLSIRHDAILEYLIYRSVGDTASAFDNVKQVPPGGYVELSADGGFVSGKWWTFPDRCDVEADPISVRDLVTRAIQRRLDAHRTNVVFLSGGLDSSIVASAMVRQGAPIQMQTMTVGYDVAGSESETGFAKRLSDELELTHEQVVVKASDVPSLMRDAAVLTEDPIQDPITLSTLVLARKALDHSKIVLTGDGSDETWGGYARFDSPPDTIRDYLPRTAIFSPTELGLNRPPPSYPQDLSPGLEQLAPLDRIMRFEVSNRLRNYHLARIDKIIMGCALEPRSPFLDIEVVEHALRIPAALKRPGGTPKGLLSAAFRGIVPDWVIERKKQPFSMPIRQWLQGPLRAYAHDLLAGPNCWVSRIVDPRPLLSICQELDQAGANKLWSLLQLENWYQGFARFMETDMALSAEPTGPRQAQPEIV